MGLCIMQADALKKAVKGAYDAQDLQKKVTEQCKQMQPLVRALFTVCEISGKIIVSAEIPGADNSERPVFYKVSGKSKVPTFVSENLTS